MADSIVDKVLDIVTKSEKIGFAAAFAGVTFFTGRHYGFKPFNEIEQPLVGYILYITLAGIGLLVARALIWIGQIIGKIKESISSHMTQRLAPMRLYELMPDELVALLWLLHHNYGRVSADRYDTPFAGLIRKGFLRPSDGPEREQVLFVNSTVLSCREEILKQFASHAADAVNSSLAPWERKPNDWMRI